MKAGDLRRALRDALLVGALLWIAVTAAFVRDRNKDATQRALRHAQAAAELVAIGDRAGALSLIHI